MFSCQSGLRHFFVSAPCLLIAVLLVSPAPAQTSGPPLFGPQPIPGLFPTGVDDGPFFSNAALQSIDPHYTLTISPPGEFGVNAFVADDRPVSYVPNQPLSQWIAPVPSLALPDGNLPTGLYFYEMQFDLTNFFENTATISGFWTADDTSRVYLNNNTNAAITQNPGFGAFTPFSFSGGFIPGVNTLTFEVNNSVGIGPFSGPSGLHVTQISGEALPRIIPEPTSAQLLALLAVAAWRRRNR